VGCGRGAAGEIRAWFRAAHISAVIIKEALSGLPSRGAVRDPSNELLVRSLTSA